MNKFVDDVNEIVEGRFGFSVHDFADFLSLTITRIALTPMGTTIRMP